MPYTLPQVKVFQEFRALPSTVIKNLNAFVFGPNYGLFRYGVAGEKALTALGTYVPGTDTDYAFPNKPSDSTVDQSYIKLYFENVWAQYATLATLDDVYVKSASQLNKLVSADYVFAQNGADNAVPSAIFQSRGVKVGDYIRYSITGADTVVRTGTAKVTGFEAEAIAAVTAAATGEAGNAQPANTLTSSGTYTGTKDTNYVVEVVRGGVFSAGRNTSIDFTGDGTHTVAAAVNFATDWNQGDVNETYTLTCTTGGSVAASRWTLTSDRGESQTGIAFTSGVALAVGTHGLKITLTTDGSGPVDFSVDDAATIVVQGKRARVRIYDSAGADSSSYVVPAENTNFDVGSYGVDLKFNTQVTKYGPLQADGATKTAGLTEGDVFYVGVTAAAEGDYKTLVLSDDLPVSGVEANSPTAFSVWFYLVQATAAIPAHNVIAGTGVNWSAENVSGTDTLTVSSGIQVKDPSWVDGDGEMDAMTVYKADMFVEYRALLTNYTDTIRALELASDVAETVGTIHPDNPLAQGLYNALLNSGNRAVYYMATPSNDLDGFNAVLDAASLSTDVYGLVPLTRDAAVLDAVQAHINAMSSEEGKQWRIGFVGATLPTSAVVYNATVHPDATEYFGKISEDPSASGEFTILTLTDSSGNAINDTEIAAVLADVVANDKVRINFAQDTWGDDSYDEFLVEATLTNNSLRLKTGPTGAISTARKVEIHHPNTVQQMADAIAAQSAGYASRRMYNVFPHELIDGSGVVQTSEFAAAAVAGLCSSVAPQQGLTNIELVGFTDLPAVYRTFNRTQLNKMAEYGTLIVMQQAAAGEVYIRHQVSTKASSQDLNQTELSITKNMDSISYFFAERLAGYIGRFNITPELLSVIRTQLTDGLLFLGAFTNIGLLGPQVLLTDKTNIGTVQQHPTLKDHIYIVLNLELPYPVNVIELHLVV